MSEILDGVTSARMKQLPRLKVDAFPGSEQWIQRLKEELTVLVQYIRSCKDDGNDWFTIAPSQNGLNWQATAPEIRLPNLIGKTPKQYRGGAICLTAHFKPLWKANSPSFGIAHALCMGLGPWLAAEVPYLASTGAIEAKS